MGRYGVAPVLGFCFTATAALAQPAGMQQGRPITNEDFAGGGFSTLMRDTTTAADGSRSVTVHLSFPPMHGYPVITVSVSQLEVDLSSGHLGYAIHASEPACTQPGTPEMVCNGFDLTVSEDAKTHISLVNVQWIAMNVLSLAAIGVSPDGKPPTATLQRVR